MKFRKASENYKFSNREEREEKGRGKWGNCLAKLIYFEAWEIQFAWLSIRTGLSFNVIEYFKRFCRLHLPPPPRAIVGKVSAWCLWMSERVPFPQHPSPALSVATLTQPLAIEVEIYLLIAWILLDLCLESWASSLDSWELSPESCQSCCMCGSSHTPEHAQGHACCQTQHQAVATRAATLPATCTKFQISGWVFAARA